MTGSARLRSRRTDKSGGLARQHNLDRTLVHYRNDSDRRGRPLCLPSSEAGMCPGIADIPPSGQGSHRGLPLQFQPVMIIAVVY